MGIAKKTDGRYVVGLGVTDANDYKGSASYRDIYIQLTADGATEESVEYLTYLKDYAVYANAQGEPIMPPSVNVWISNNGKTTAVEADDLSLDGDDFTICGIVYSDGEWDYSNAGSGHGGGGSDLPEVTSADEGKVLAVNASGEWAASAPYDFIMTATDDDGPYYPAEIIKGDNALLNDFLNSLNPINGVMIVDESDSRTYWRISKLSQGENGAVAITFITGVASIRYVVIDIDTDNEIVFE